VSRLARTLLLAAVTFCLVAPSASAAPTSRLGGTLGDLWTTVLETPTPHNPFADPPGDQTCFVLGGKIVAPFGPSGAKSCTVKPGTKIFVAGWTTECSTFAGDTCGGTHEAELRANARAADAGITVTVTLDGKPVPVVEVETPLLNIVLPADNVFGLPAGTQGLSVGHGWVALLHPLTPGTHTIVIVTAHPAPDPPTTITTTIVVKPGGQRAPA
jgi:hypothetical protein